MSEFEPRPNERRYERQLTEMDLALFEGGAVLDEAAHAVDVSAAGFRAVTRATLREGQTVDFELVLSDGSRVRGRGKVKWSAKDAFQFDFYSAGVKITRMAWGDSSKLRSTIYTPGYDFAGTARAMFWALFLIVVALALENVLFRQSTTRAILWKLGPVMAALAVLAGSLFALLG